MSHTSEVEGNAVTRALKLEPALLRGTLVGITTVVAVVTGKNIDVAWVDNALFIYAAVSPIIAGLLIRPKVTPNVKVIVQARDLIERLRREGALNPPPDRTGE